MPLRFTQVDKSSAGWVLFLVQLFPLAPIAIMAVWLVVGYLLRLTGLLHALRVPASLQDVEADVSGAVTLLVSSFIAGVSVGGVWPSLRSSGRWIFLPSLPVALGFVLTWRQYLSYNSRSSWLVVLLDWACDPSMYIAYGYVGYSAAMALFSRRDARGGEKQELE